MKKPFQRRVKKTRLGLRGTRSVLLRSFNVSTI
jgi:hypothetical protein